MKKRMATPAYRNSAFQQDMARTLFATNALCLIVGAMLGATIALGVML